MSIINQILEKSKSNKELISLWEYGDDNFWCGYVINYNSTLVQIQHFSKYGQNDGIVILRIENIESIDFEDEYVDILQYLINNFEEKIKLEFKEIILPDSEDWQTILLKQFEGNGKIVSFEINGSEYYSGLILHCSDKDFVAKMIGSRGEIVANAIYKNENITAFKINNIEQRKRLLLFNRHK